MFMRCGREICGYRSIIVLVHPFAFATAWINGGQAMILMNQSSLLSSSSSSSSYISISLIQTASSLMAEVKFGHGLKAILKDAVVAVDWNSCSFYDQLCAGIFLNKGTKKYWLEKKTNSNCFNLYARALSITWSENSQYWRWIIIKESCNTPIEVAELVRVSWLNIHGEITAPMLSPGILYEVVFEIMKKKDACGWDVPVNIKLKKPDGSIQERKESLLKLPKEEWVQIPVGNFILSDNDICGCSKIEFSLYEHGGHWKSGLLVKSAIIRPKPLC